MTPDLMCITDLDGRKLQGDRDPSSEMLMHLEVYRQRPDVQAVVHSHPPTATGFAVAGIPVHSVGADLRRGRGRRGCRNLSDRAGAVESRLAARARRFAEGCGGDRWRNSVNIPRTLGPD